MSRFTYKALDSKKSSAKKYTAHKSWTITDETATTYGVVPLSGSYASSSFETAPGLKTNDIYQRLVFDSIHHLYYADPNNSHISSDSEFMGEQHRELLSDIQVFSIPSNIYGDRIVPGSVYLDVGAIDFWDDGKGNLLSTYYLPKHHTLPPYHMLTYGWPPNPDSTFIYISFDSERDNPVGDTLPSTLKSKGENVNRYPTCQNTISGFGRKLSTQLSYHPLTHRAAELSGTASIDSGSESVIEIQNTTGIDNWNSDFAISCWVKIPTSQSVSSSFTGPLLPGTQRTLESHTENVIATSRGFIDNPGHNSIIPWEISVVNDGIGTDAVGKIYARRGQYDDVTLLTSSLSHNITGSEDVWTHVLFQKTGSELQLLVNSGSTTNHAEYSWWRVGNNTSSVAMATGSDPLSNIDIISHTNICIGAQRAGYKQIKIGSKETSTPSVKYNPAYIKPLSASIDEFTIYNQALNSTPASIDSLSRKGPIESMYFYGTPHPYVGNVFYNHGIITITDNFSTQDAELAASNYTLTFSGSHDITAHSYKCTVEDGEYNMTLNPTARQGNSLNNQQPAGFVTSSDFTPYITTIGLYNDNSELLAIGKLAQPVKSPKDFDITFIVQFDT